MRKERFERISQGEVILDICFDCRAIWFDEHENVQLTPGGIIELFRLINEQPRLATHPLATVFHCPRCDERLLHGLDISKFGGRFSYHRCVQKHGRFVTFAQFMIEKGFVRQLVPAEVTMLAAKIGSVRCNGCGAVIDIRAEHACSHCRAPITILDEHAVKRALGRRAEAENRQGAMDVEVLGNAIVVSERQSLHGGVGSSGTASGVADVVDLLGSSVELLFSILSD